jgi:hypothetical protein
MELSNAQLNQLINTCRRPGSPSITRISFTSPANRQVHDGASKSNFVVIIHSSVTRNVTCLIESRVPDPVHVALIPGDRRPVNQAGGLFKRLKFLGQVTPGRGQEWHQSETNAPPTAGQITGMND